MTTAQLCMMRAIATKGWPTDLISHLLTRCGASEQEWQSLISESLVAIQSGAYKLTQVGKRQFNAAKKNRYF